MSAKIDQFCNDLRARLSTVEGRVYSLKASIQALPRDSEESVRKKLDRVRHQFQVRREHLDQTHADFDALAQEDLAETEDAIGRWSANRESRKLDTQADLAAEYAADSIDLAWAAINDAEEAILAAMVARLDAEAAKSSAPAPR